MSDEPLPMLQGKFMELKKMSKKQKDTEITAWRNIWSYVPSEVKSHWQVYCPFSDGLSVAQYLLPLPVPVAH